ncbi:MAG: penicillin-binding protein 2 [Anaerolineae bacterium]
MFRNDNPPNNPVRLGIYRLVVVLILVIFAARIYQIQFLQADEFISQANENRFEEVSEPATRGIIVDRNGVPLATNVASANVVVTPALLPEDEEEELEVLGRVASLLGIPLSGDPGTVDERGIPERSVLGVVREIEGIAPYRPAVVRSDVPYDIARLIIAEDLPGVDVEWLSARSYPTGALSAHIIGYMGPIPQSVADEYEAQGYVLDRDRIGYDGIEFVFNEQLAGSPGLRLVERDVAGQIIRTVGETVEPEPGLNLRLTIDVELQQYAQERLIEELEALRDEYPDDEIGFDRGVVIATVPNTGEVLALVSWPTFNNQRFARTIDYPYYLRVSQDPEQPLFNQAVGSLYPPGSVFKIITATAALEEGIVEPEDAFFDPGEIQLENRYYPNDPGQSQTFVCWLNDEEGGHGFVNLIESLAYSCDVYYYKVGGGFEDELDRGIGITGLKTWMEHFGLGEATGLELPGDQTIGQIAVVPDSTWKRRVWGESWSTGDTFNASFGQGYVTTTPLQMLHAMNIVINDGAVVRPTLVYEWTDSEGVVRGGFEPDIVGQMPASLETIRLVQQGMRAAVTLDDEGIREGGTAQTSQEIFDEAGQAMGMVVATAGKTGTAEYCDNIAANLERCIPGSWPAHAWYMGYAPYDNPEISVIAFLYNGQEGSGRALPVATDVMVEYFRLKLERALQDQQTASGQP